MIKVYNLSGEISEYPVGTSVDEIEQQMYEKAGGTETSHARRRNESPKIVLISGGNGYETNAKPPAGDYAMVKLARKRLPMPRR